MMKNLIFRFCKLIGMVSCGFFILLFSGRSFAALEMERFAASYGTSDSDPDYTVLNDYDQDGYIDGLDLSVHTATSGRREVLWIKAEDDPLDGVLDSSSYEGHGTCTSCPSLTLDSKVGDYAYEFDRGDYFGISERVELQPQTMTFAFWLKVLSAIGTDTILGLCGSSSGTGHQGYRFVYDQEQNAIRFQVGHQPVGTRSNGLRTSVKTGEEIELGRWYHIAGRWDGERVAIFVDGKVSNENYFKNMDSETNPVTYGCGTNELFVGSGLFYGDTNLPRSQRHANIILDDLRMYDYPMADKEVLALAAGADGDCSTGTKPCPKQSGVCAGSMQVCSGSAWPGCSDEAYSSWSDDFEPREENCSDGLDNDCDGKTDYLDNDCSIIAVSRTAGVAPLAVFFHAISNFDWEFIEQSDFIWDFGDGSPLAHGYMAAHVYELADDAPTATFPVVLSIKQNGRIIATEEKNIVVSPFSGRTLCVSSSADFTECPSSSSADHFTDIGGAWDEVESNTRLLLRRGDQWSSTTQYTKTGMPGPVIVGAFGEGNRPKVVFTDQSQPTFLVYGSQDWRFMDLHVQGGGGSAGFGATCLTSGGNCRDLLILRTRIEDSLANVAVPGVKDGFFVFDSSFADLNRYLVYNYYGEDIAFVNVEARESGSHFYRIGGPERLLVTGNDIADAPKTDSDQPTTHDVLTIRGGGNYSRYSLIQDNLFRKPGWLVQLGSQNSGSAGPFRYMVIEGNTFAPYPGESETGTGLLLDGYDAVIRNNLFLDAAYACSVGVRYTFDDTRRIGIYNNTHYNSPGHRGSGFLRFNTGADARDITVYNNILSGVGGCWSLFSGDTADINEIESDYNIWYLPEYQTFFGSDLQTWQAQYGNDVHSLIVDPQFVSLDPLDEGFLKPGPLSPAVDSGGSVPVFIDFMGNARPLDGDNDGDARWDRGAFEFVPVQ